MSDRVKEMIVDAIRGGVFREGDRLPSERELSSQIGVSRTIVSRAIDDLELAGLLESRRGRGGGTFVVSETSIPTELKRVRGGHREVMNALLQAREAIEYAIVELASENAVESDVLELREQRQDLEPLTSNPIAYSEAGMRFHLKIAEIAGNPFIVDFLRHLLREQAALRVHFLDDPGVDELRTYSLSTYDGIIDAIVEGERKLIADSVRRHIDGVRAIYLGPDSRANARGSGRP
jgi:GntR family transcriptional repressor for pyruvate dehydrogenase complex